MLSPVPCPLSPVPSMIDRFRILIVEDDQVDRMAVRRALKAAGVEADFRDAEDVASALEVLREEEFDCVFLDYQLPGGDGLRVLRDARSAGVDAPIVVLTGQEDTQTAVELMKAGASDYLSKSSVSPRRIEQSLRHAVRVHQAERQMRRAERDRESALETRGRFLAAMSHELRTPINAIIGYNDLLLTGIYGEMAPKQQHGLQRAQNAARHLLELVNDVLDLSKLEAGKVELQIEPVDIHALIEDLFVTVCPLAEERGSELSLVCHASLGTIRTDPRRVRQILLNLLSNAIKFGQGNPVQVCCLPAEGGGVAIEVIDHGIGIAEESLSRVFEEFVQIPGSQSGGTGLGLSISKGLAELLGGRLEATSDPGRGSVFQLILPGEMTNGG